MSLLGLFCLTGTVAVLMFALGAVSGWVVRGGPEADDAPAVIGPRALRDEPGRVRCALRGFEGVTKVVRVRCRTNGEPPKVIRPHGALHERYRWTTRCDERGRWIYEQEHA